MKYELYKGAEIIVDYKAQANQDIIDHFEEASNFEGFASLLEINYDEGIFTIDDKENDWISFEYLIVQNLDTNEYEYIEV